MQDRTIAAEPANANAVLVRQHRHDSDRKKGVLIGVDGCVASQSRQAPSSGAPGQAHHRPSLAARHKQYLEQQERRRLQDLELEECRKRLLQLATLPKAATPDPAVMAGRGYVRRLDGAPAQAAAERRREGVQQLPGLTPGDTVKD